MENIALKDEVDKTSRTVESQERQIEALQSQIGEVDNPTLYRKSKVGVAVTHVEICTIIDLLSFEWLNWFNDFHAGGLLTPFKSLLHVIKCFVGFKS